MHISSEAMKSRLKVKKRIRETIKYYVGKLSDHYWCVQQLLLLGHVSNSHRHLPLTAAAAL